MQAASAGVAPAGGGGITDPTDIANLWVWLDADQITASNGDPLASWADQSGNSRTFTTFSSGSATYQTNVINTTMPAVLFGQDKAMQYTGALLETDATLANHAHSVVAVVQHTDSQDDTFFAQSTDTVGDGWYLRATGTDDEFNASTVRTLGGGVSDDVKTTGDANSVNTWHYLIYVSDGADITLRVDGTDFTGTRGVYNSGGADSGMRLGAERNTASYFYYFTGYIAELFAYNAVLTSQNITDIESYLTSKWGL